MVIALDRDVPATASAAAAGAPTTFAELRPAYCLLGAPLAGVIAGVALAIAAADGPSAVEVVRPILVVLWAAAGLLLGLRRRRGTTRTDRPRRSARRCRRHSRRGDARPRASTGPPSWPGTSLCASLPRCFRRSPCTCCSGWPTAAWRRRSAATRCSSVTPPGCARPRSARQPGASLVWPLVVFWLAALAIGLYAAHARYVKAGAEDRRRMQWIGWGMAVAAEAAVVVIALRLLSGWPDDAGAVALALTGFVPVGLACGTLPRMVARSTACSPTPWLSPG